MAQQGESGSFDQISLTFVVFFIAIGITLLIWWLKREVIIAPINAMRYYEAIAIQWFVHMSSNLVSLISLGHWHFGVSQNTVNVTQAIHSAVPYDETYKNFSYTNTQVAKLVRYPCILLMAVMAFVVYRFSGSNHFKQNYSMKSLRQCEVKNWPQITPIVSLDLVKQDINEGPWAMSINPLDFGKEHELVYRQQVGDHLVWGIDEKKASRIFSMQLGRLWRGVDSLPIHAKALMVIFLACATKNRAQAKKFLAQIAASSASGKLNFSGVEEAANAYRSSHILKWVSRHHAYNATVMATLLELARTDGVLASAEFLWLKPVDRRLWYMLNSVGRQTAVVEVSGVFSHWLSEKRMKRPLKTPVVKSAVDAYKVALADILYIDESELWHFNEA